MAAGVMDASRMTAPVVEPAERSGRPAPPQESFVEGNGAGALAGWPRFVRLEYVLLAATALLITLFAFLFFYFEVSYQHLTTYGYIGLFAVSLISAASIVMPMPGAFA